MIRKKWKGICLVGCLILGSSCFLGAEGSSAAYQQWLKYKETVKKDPSVIRYYTFEELKDMKVKNLAGETGDLFFIDGKAKPGEPFAEDWKTVSGRWPEKKAAWLDQCSLLDKTYTTDTGKFTFECWVKFIDYGRYQVSDRNSGTIVTLGSGYGNGWRLIVLGTAYKLCFQIGGTDAVGRASMTSGNIALKTWQYVAITWDGKTMNTYVNGLLVGTREHKQPYIPINKLVIGYSGYGTGSIKIEMDEAIIYSRALTAEEIARHFNLQP